MSLTTERSEHGITDAREKESAPPDWTDASQLLLKWHDFVAVREKINFAAAVFYRGWHYGIGIPLTIFSSVAATKLFKSHAQGSSTAWVVIITLCIPILSALQTFLHLNDQAEKHRVMAGKYGSLKRAMEETLAIPPAHRGDQHKVLDGLRTEMDRIERDEPPIPYYIVLQSHIQQSFGDVCNRLLDRFK